LCFYYHNMKLFIYLIISIFTILGCKTVASSDINISKDGSYQRSLSEEIVFDNHTYLDHIRTVEMYRSGWRLSLPMRNMRDTASLILEFDDLSEEAETYTYTLIHCTAEWEPSDLVNSAYLNGLVENEIRDFRYSRTALKTYTHYRLSIPNSDVQPKLPGNYILFVYKDFNQNEPVLTRRFYLIDPLVRIDTDIHRTDNVSLMTTTQEVDFSVIYSQLEPDDPRRNFKVSIFQNLNPETAITDLLPKYIQPGELIYNYEEENLFPGGSEFLHFDTKSLKYNSDRVQDIRFEKGLKQVYLKPDLPKAYSNYQFQEDLNGKYLVKWDDAFDSDIEADYVMVHFQLKTGEPIDGSAVYLYGGLTGWKLEEGNLCTYNAERGTYEIELLLKQGYYNYAYATRDQASGKAEFTLIDGNYYETENDYYLFVYYRDIRERFDRLVGLKIANSVKRGGSGY
jgi:hypothetical protein